MKGMIIMTTRNFVPRADGEGSIGTAAKNWFSGYFKQLNVASMTVNDNQNPIADTAALATLLSNLANMVKQNKGTDDWKTAPATNLATLAALVGNLASGSDVTWEGNKFTNAKLGITGLMEQNGYICFGKNFGGLILQWGTYNVICDYLQGPPDGRYEGQVVLAFPLSFSNACYAALASVAADVGGPSDEATSVRKTTTDKFHLWGEVSSANATITASCVFLGC